MALLQADGSYNLERGTDRGDEQDIWVGYAAMGRPASIGPSSSVWDSSGLSGLGGPHPNTDSYQGGEVRRTGVRVYNVSPSGPTMTFKIDLEDDGDREEAGSEENREREVVTTIKGGYVNYGVMFNIIAEDGDANSGGAGGVEVTGLDIHTRLEGPNSVHVKVYSKAGPHSGYEDRPEAWDVTCDTASSPSSMGLDGKGLFKRTSIPSSLFRPVPIPPGSTASFYVSMDTKDLIYSEGEMFLGILAENNDLRVLEGIALGGPGPFSEAFRPRIFNGSIRYRVLSDGDAETVEPVTTRHKENPPEGTQELITPFDGGNGSYGSMFDIRSSPYASVTITSLAIHSRIPSGTDLGVEVYAKPGSYRFHESNAASWVRICCGDAVIGSAGSMSQSVLPPHVFDPVTIGAGEVRAFYVTLRTPDLRYTSSREVSYLHSDDWISMEGGVGIGGYPFGGGESAVYRSRAPNVAIMYTASAAQRTIGITRNGDSELVTALDGTTKSRGIMFDVRAAGGGDVIVTSLDVRTGAARESKVDVTVYARRGSHVGHERTPDSWTEICCRGRGAEGMGPDVRTALPSELFTPIHMAFGEVHSFFVVLGSPNLLYTTPPLPMTATTVRPSVGDVHRSDGHVEVLVGTGVGDFPLMAYTDTYKPRIFDGAVRYYPLT